VFFLLLKCGRFFRSLDVSIAAGGNVGVFPQVDFNGESFSLREKVARSAG
jgi:hypothetical protein